MICPSLTQIFACFTNVIWKLDNGECPVIHNTGTITMDTCGYTKLVSHGNNTRHFGGDESENETLFNISCFGKHLITRIVHTIKTACINSHYLLTEYSKGEKPLKEASL